MKRLLTIIVTTVCCLITSPAGACLLKAFEHAPLTADFIDRQTYAMDFGLLTVNAQYIDDTFDIVHALPTDATIGKAWITFDFIGDFLDAKGSFWGFAWDFREYVSVSYDRTDWMPLGVDGEVDNGSYRLDLTDWLPLATWAEDELLLALKVANPLGTGDVFLQQTTLYTNLSATPVPIPGALGLFASGLAVFGYARKTGRKRGHAV